MVERFSTRMSTPFTALARGTYGEMKKSPFAEGITGIFKSGALLKLALPIVIAVTAVLVVLTLITSFALSPAGMLAKEGYEKVRDQ